MFVCVIYSHQFNRLYELCINEMCKKQNQKKTLRIELYSWHIRRTLKNNITKETQIKFYIPTLTYGSETWVILIKEKKIKIQAHEMRYLRS